MQRGQMQKRRRQQRGQLPVDHPTALAFLDESGSISLDRFFAVGCLKMREPSKLFSHIQKLRNKEHWYGEIHFVDLTKNALPFYKKVVHEIAAASDVEFSCFVADRDAADPVARFGSSWLAYEKLATQLLLGSIRRSARADHEVLADNYSTPDNVVFEKDVRTKVNARLGRLGVLTVCRLDSKAADPLQLVDLLTSAVAFEFRQSTAALPARTPQKPSLRRKFARPTGLLPASRDASRAP